MTSSIETNPLWAVEATHTTADGYPEAQVVLVRAPAEVTQQYMQSLIRSMMAESLSSTGVGRVALGSGQDVRLGRAWLISPTDEDIELLRKAHGDDGVWVGTVPGAYEEAKVLYLLPTIFTFTEWVEREHYKLQRQLKRKVAEARQFAVDFESGVPA